MLISAWLFFHIGAGPVRKAFTGERFPAASPEDAAARRFLRTKIIFRTYGISEKERGF